MGAVGGVEQLEAEPGQVVAPPVGLRHLAGEAGPGVVELLGDQLVELDVVVLEHQRVVVGDLEGLVVLGAARHVGVEAEHEVEVALVHHVAAAVAADRIGVVLEGLEPVGRPPGSVVLALEPGRDHQVVPEVGVVVAIGVGTPPLDPVEERPVLEEALGGEVEDLGVQLPPGRRLVGHEAEGEGQVGQVVAVVVADRRAGQVVPRGVGGVVLVPGAAEVDPPVEVGEPPHRLVGEDGLAGDDVADRLDLERRGAARGKRDGGIVGAGLLHHELIFPMRYVPGLSRRHA